MLWKTKLAERLAANLSLFSKGDDGNPAYRQVITTEGAKENTTYPTLQAAAQEMIGGMLDSLD